MSTVSRVQKLAELTAAYDRKRSEIESRYGNLIREHQAFRREVMSLALNQRPNQDAHALEARFDKEREDITTLIDSLHLANHTEYWSGVEALIGTTP